MRTMLRFGIALSLLGASFSVLASGLQVSPIVLQMSDQEKSGNMTLSNTSDQALYAQVRVYRWTQDDSGDVLTASREILASPPMVKLKAGDSQLVRLIRTAIAAQNNNVVSAYRILIDELPTPSATQQSGLQFKMSYSVPVFLQPAGKNVAPQLQWRAQRLADGKHIKLSITNSGNSYAKLSGLQVIAADGQTKEIHQGLLGYVLPNATMHWTLPTPSYALTADSRFKVTMNGIQSSPTILWDSTAR